jgi:carboxylesterase type B
MKLRLTEILDTPFGLPSGGQQSEDCLFLHVFAPQIKMTSSTSEGKTVMVFFHGGGLMMGGIGGPPRAGGSPFAAKDDIIIVHPSYRVGIFGFPGNVPGLPADSLNPGFRDQKMALQWVQENISKFGGDPKKVTIFGQSGGAVSVDSHLVSSVDNPPFRAAISQSGGLHTATTVFPGIGIIMTGAGGGNKEGVPPFHTLAEALGCKIADAVPCVRSKSVADINAVISKQKLSFSIPADDAGKTMWTNHDSARRAKKVTKVPVMIGNNWMEALMFSSQLKDKSVEDWAKVIYPKDPVNAKAVADAYSPSQFKSDSEATTQLNSDFQFACIAAYEAKMIESTGVRK